MVALPRSRAQEAVWLLKTNDPAGFNLIDVLSWGALGHAAGYFILATNRSVTTMAV
jgi:photosystem I subunit V